MFEFFKATYRQLATVLAVKVVTLKFMCVYVNV